MKLPMIAATVLLAGTSALAFAPSYGTADPAAGPAIEKPLVKEVVAAKEAQTAGATWTDEAPALQTAALSTWDERASASGDDLDLAEQPDPNEPVAADTSEADTSYAEDPVDVEVADSGEADISTAGVGGPIETADASAAAAPRPAAGNYPPCSPGPGDDNCIQLYEPGVREALASWSQPTGGLMQPGEAMASAEAIEEPATGVGGPYEPVEAGYSGDGVVDTAVGETEAAEATGAPDAIY